MAVRSEKGRGATNWRCGGGESGGDEGRKSEGRNGEESGGEAGHGGERLKSEGRGWEEKAEVGQTVASPFGAGNW